VPGIEASALPEAAFVTSDRVNSFVFGHRLQYTFQHRHIDWEADAG
jgi:hypothetical protein